MRFEKGCLREEGKFFNFTDSLYLKMSFPRRSLLEWSVLFATKLATRELALLKELAQNKIQFELYSPMVAATLKRGFYFIFWIFFFFFFYLFTNSSKYKRGRKKRG